MLTFNPVELKEHIRDIISRFEFLEGSIEEIEFGVFIDETAFDDYDIIITEDSDVSFYFDQDEYPILPVKEFLSIFDGWNTCKINSNQSYARDSNNVFFLLDVSDYKSVMILEGLSRSANTILCSENNGYSLWKTDVSIGGKEYSVSLYHGFCIYHYKVWEKGNYDEFNPVYSGEYGDFFVRVTGENIEQSIADAIAESFVFELQSTHNLILQFSVGRPDFEEINYEDGELSDAEYGIFPLLYGRGIKALLGLYNKAKSIADDDFRILTLTKVIEYISPTIARSKLYERVRLKLSSPAALCPTADFVNELERVFTKYHADINKDYELIRLAVSTVVDADSLSEYLPKYIKTKFQRKETDIIDNSQAIIDYISEAIYDTRNEIAHAKANYEKKGKECPSKEKEFFSKMLEIIAIRCIRWFGMQPDDKRIVLDEI